MLGWSARVGLLSLSLAAACGGSVTGGGSEDDEATLPDTKDPPTQSEPSGRDNPNADTELGECKLGVSAYGDEAYPCAWIAGERCYGTREMACNCACPRDRNSQCSSGFEGGPDGRVDVYCY